MIYDFGDGTIVTTSLGQIRVFQIHKAVIGETQFRDHSIEAAEKIATKRHEDLIRMFFLWFLVFFVANSYRNADTSLGGREENEHDHIKS